MNDSNDFSLGFGIGFLFLCGILSICGMAFTLGSTFGKAHGEKKTALITVQALNKIKQQLPKDTKISNPFTKEQLDTLSHDAQDILKLSGN
jgi:hypothetical protein